MRPAGEVSMKRSRRPGWSSDDRDTTADAVSLADREDTFTNQRRPAAPGTLENTYRTGPDQCLEPHKVEALTEAILAEHLGHVDYDPRTCKQLSQEVAARIMDKIKTLPFRRYKLVAVVSIGSTKERSGLQFGSRCLWGPTTDTFSSVKFSNGSLFAVAMIYALYFE